MLVVLLREGRNKIAEGHTVLRASFCCVRGTVGII